jgi:hypothetical protein
MDAMALPGVKQPGRDDDHSRPSSAEVKSKHSYSPAPPIWLHSVGINFLSFVFKMIKDKEIGGVCITHGGDEIRKRNFRSASLLQKCCIEPNFLSSSGCLLSKYIRFAQHTTAVHSGKCWQLTSEQETPPSSHIPSNKLIHIQVPHAVQYNPCTEHGFPLYCLI